jgi:hypothetical protein
MLPVLQKWDEMRVIYGGVLVMGRIGESPWRLTICFLGFFSRKQIV